MFLDELTPVFKEFTKHPAAFLGGFVSGILRVNLNDDPVKSWLDAEAGITSYPSSTTNSDNGRSSGPQSISID
ncbi:MULTISPECIES: hypothetical protein [Cyanophyceae]|uniref:hypothetical protein n=1 Tax=Cyanophyceae TaxID=3028117 RepID=UPI001687FB9C|nr:hypothetical protein [Trichocoleus sp. FACHB-69]MBD1930950.1 hypothetical protein [Trichocoleus sp. FACHB-69]